MSHVRQHFHKRILWLILDHPPLNLLTIPILDQLTAGLQSAVRQNARLVVITGTGEQAFSGGWDLQELAKGQARELLKVSKDTFAAFEELQERKIPTIALVKGQVTGAGCELALRCDTVIAREDARFSLPGIDQGLISPAAAVYFPAHLSHQTTMRLLVTGEIIEASEALRLGMAHQVLPHRSFLIEAEELLTMLATIS